MTESILLAVDARGVATLTLNRAECHNAIDQDCANLLTAHLETLAEDDGIRLVVLTGNGISFSAGHDITALRRQTSATPAELRRETAEYARLLMVLDRFAKPTIARVQGSAFGLGIGLIACCDFAIGVTDALFGFSEVRQGAMAGILAPFLIRAIGMRATRRYLIGSERFNAGKAKRLGLLHQDVAPGQLGHAVEQLIRQLLINGPQAMSATKRMLADLESPPIDTALIERLTDLTVAVRNTDEGREGLDAFVEHRAPRWVG